MTMTLSDNVERMSPGSRGRQPSLSRSNGSRPRGSHPQKGVVADLG